MKKTKPSKTKTNIGSDILEITSYDSELELSRRGIYYITSEIDSDSLLEIHQDILLKHMTTSWKDDIQIIVNSPGGLVSEGMALIDLLEWVRMDVRTVALGYCASMGACLACCGTKGKRFVAPNTSIMIHCASWSAHGTGAQIAAVSEEMKRERERDMQFWIKHSKYKSKTDIERHFLHGKHDVFLNAQEAIKHGIFDGIVGEKKKR